MKFTSVLLCSCLRLELLIPTILSVGKEMVCQGSWVDQLQLSCYRMRYVRSTSTLFSCQCYKNHLVNIHRIVISRGPSTGTLYIYGAIRSRHNDKEHTMTSQDTCTLNSSHTRTMLLIGSLTDPYWVLRIHELCSYVPYPTYISIWI